MAQRHTQRTQYAAGLVILFAAFVILAVSFILLEPHIAQQLTGQFRTHLATEATTPRPSSTIVPAFVQTTRTPTTTAALISPTSTPLWSPTSTQTLTPLPTISPTVAPSPTPLPPTLMPPTPAPTSTPYPTWTVVPPTPTIGPLAYTNRTNISASYLASLCRAIIRLTNQQRVAHGLTALVPNQELDALAAQRSEDMIKRNYFSHYDPLTHQPLIRGLLDMNDVPYQMVGENLVDNRGYPLDDHTPAQVVLAWMDSPDHRRNILDPTYTEIGVGAATTLLDGALRVVFTQIFLQ